MSSKQDLLKYLSDKVIIKYAILGAVALIAIGCVLKSQYLLSIESFTHLPVVGQLRSRIEKQASKSNVYRVVVVDKNKTIELKHEHFLEYLEDILGLSQGLISHIVYDVRDGSPHDPGHSVLDFSYYILLKGDPVSIEQTYENEAILLQVTDVDKRMIPYIQDADYCEIDADCIIRTNFCNYGAFNYYHSFQYVWGCADLTLTEFECNTTDIKPECSSMYYDEDMGCVRDVKYIGAGCINNKCLAQTQIVSCLEK